LSHLPPSPADENLGPLQLAWLGDAVWELHQRLRHCQRAGRSDDLHRAVVAKVKAEAQAQALQQLEPLLNDNERDLARRGRNRARGSCRGGSAGTYGQATGFETMLGWLFLRNPQRLAELLVHLDKTDPSPPPPNP
jgi:ribonuclease-3 family protein